MVYDVELFGKLFKKLRMQNKFTLEQLSKSSSISKRIIQQIEHGKSTSKIQTLSILSYYLNTDLLELLLKCTGLENQKLSFIIDQFKKDTALSKFDNLETYIHELDSLLAHSKYDAHDLASIEFHISLEETLMWLKAVEQSELHSNYDTAEQLLLDALKIRYPQLNLQNLSGIKFNNIELSILNAFVVNRSRHHCHDQSIDLLKYIIKEQDNSLLLDPYLYSFASINLANIYFVRDEYDKIKDVCQHYENARKRLGIDVCYAKLLFISAATDYVLGHVKSIDKIVDALRLYRYDNCEHMIPILINALATGYDIPITLEDIS